MRSEWTTGLSKELERDVRGSFLEAIVLRKRLKEILSKRINNSNEVCRNKSSYDNPNWGLLQADQRGFERALSEIIALIE